MNYWKEYVTNSNTSKKSGSKAETEKELNEARTKLINLTDDVNEAEKRSTVASAKILVQNKEIDELKNNLQESNNLINMHKATVSDLKTELASVKASKKEAVDRTGALPPVEAAKAVNGPAEERVIGALSPSSDSSSERGETGDIESKFLTLREKMKRIEKELFLKSKELEKANESRSKVAKYTRTLLQELEAKLNDTQRKLIDSNEKLNNSNIELEMERERRKMIQSDKASRTSSVSSTKSIQEQTSLDLPTIEASLLNERSETEVGNRYVDYYRSRFREAEAALYEKDKKLSESESKIRELESRYKTVVKQCRSLDDIQVKLSDATHKLSDRQLKIHELTRKVEKLRGYERGYDRKSKELQTLTQNTRNTEDKFIELKRKLSAQERELEVFKIREVVMKERLSVLEEESSDESEDDEDHGDARLERSIEAKKRVEMMIDLEGQVRLLTSENERLKLEQAELQEQVSDNDDLRKEMKETGDIIGEGKDGLEGVQGLEKEKGALESQVKELEEKIIAEEDKLCRSISELKEIHKNEIESMKSTYRHEMAEFAKLKEEKSQILKEKEDELQNELQAKEESLKLTSSVNELEKQIGVYKDDMKEKEIIVSERNRQIAEFDKSLQDLSASLAEKSQIISNLNENLEDQNMHLKSQSDKVEYLEKLNTEKSNMAKNFENDNSNLREKVLCLENKLFDAKERQDSVSNDGTSSSDVVDAGTEDNTELWEELKKTRNALLKSHTMTGDFRNELESIGRKYFDSEQKVIDLARELDTRIGRLFICCC